MKNVQFIQFRTHLCHYFDANTATFSNLNISIASTYYFFCFDIFSYIFHILSKLNSVNENRMQVQVLINYKNVILYFLREIHQLSIVEKPFLLVFQRVIAE